MLLDRVERDAIAELTQRAEDLFVVQVGAPMAYMELPQRDGGAIVRVVYETIAFFLEKQNPFDYNLGPLVDAFKEALGTLHERANGLRDGSPFLYWRIYPEFAEEDNHLHLRARLGVLNSQTLEQVNWDSERPSTRDFIPSGREVKHVTG